MSKKHSKYIGIDVGGTKTLLQTFDEKLNIIREIQVKTKKSDVSGQLAALIDGVINQKIKGIGIAVPGIVDIKKGELIHAPHLKLKKKLGLKKILEKRYGCLVYVDNDINAFLAGELNKTKFKNVQNAIALMIGTGVGGAAYINGNLLYGKNGFAGEFGHMIIDKSSELKTLEQNTSGAFIPAIAKQLGIKTKQPITTYKLAEMMAAKSPSGCKIQQAMIESLGVGLGSLNLIFNPEVIILGGSVYNLFLSSRKKKLEKIIARQSLDKKSPKLIDASQKTSVAKGIVLELLSKK